MTKERLGFMQKSLKKGLLFFVSFVLFQFQAQAIVNMQNANYSESYTDMDKVIRTYNSRSIDKGIFGFGWCSSLETRLEVISETMLRVHNCGSGLRTDFKRSSQKGSQNQYISTRSRGDVVKRSSRGFLRSFGLGQEQSYSLTGSLTQWRDVAGRSLVLKYNRNNELSEMRDHKGGVYRLKRSKDRRGNRVLEIEGPRKANARYVFSATDNLIFSKDRWGNVHRYKYDKLHNMISVSSKKGTKKIEYNRQKDWVTGFVHEDGCRESYKYQSTFKSGKYRGHKVTLVKKCGKKIVNNSSYEFVYKPSNKKGDYLHKVISEVQGYKKEITFHPTLGVQTKVLENGVLTTFQYNDQSQILKKKNAIEEHSFSYNRSCRKVSKMESRYYRVEPSKGKNVKRNFATVDGIKQLKRKQVKKVSTHFKYNRNTCLLENVRNSEGRRVSLKYEGDQVSQIHDQSLKKLKIKYDKTTGRMSTITVEGIGSARLSFEGGKARIVAGRNSDLVVANQIGDIFNNFLAIIKPAKEASI